MVMGSPGKVVRELSVAEGDGQHAGAVGALHYVENWKRYAAELTPLASPAGQP